ncbi:MAG: hypothetical protein ND807_05120 [Vicinamibacterales bacterium]|nr:hypothetical protein [Vicinamibacterales bacterium]
MNAVGRVNPARAALALLLVLLATLCVSPHSTVARVSADALPSRLSDQEFWQTVEDMSERGGYFRSDNLLSNEDAFQHVIPTLERRLPSGGVYLGVGPDQNFTYIVAMHPKMAFVVDIRRQNMLLHLMYKAIIELSADRAEFLSRLFSRPMPEGLTSGSRAAELFDAFFAVPPSASLFSQNLSAVIDRLVRVHRFDLSSDDLASIEYVYRAFYSDGPELRYSFPRQGFGGRWFPSYAELMTATDTDGVEHSYLADERNFQALRSYEVNNLIVPLVGDFGGDKALRSVGRYLAAHRATVTLFYTSNVEQYLFQSGDQWRRFFDNVASLPVNDSSTLLRSYFNMGGMGFRRLQPFGPRSGFTRSGMLLDSIPELLDAVQRGSVHSYYDVIEHSSSLQPVF